MSLRPYQIDGARALASRRKLYLGDDFDGRNL